MAPRSLLVALLLVMVACTGNDDATTAPSATSRSDPPTTSTTTSSTTTSTTTTTTVPGAAAVAATCSTLQTAPLAERRAALDSMAATYATEGGGGAFGDAVRAACPDDLVRFEEAAALAQRVAAIGPGVEMLNGTLDCTADTATITWSNASEEPLGLVVFGLPGPAAGPGQGVAVEWSLAPGELEAITVPIAGGDEGPDECRVATDIFLADDSRADAGIGAPPAEPDDPAIWLPRLIGDTLAWNTTPTANAVDTFLDLRSLAHDDFSAMVDPDTDVHPLASVHVCDGTVEQPTPHQMAFAYFAEFGPSATDGPLAALLYATFRRGSDGRWRLLSTPQPLDGSFTGFGCGVPIPHP